MSQSPATSQPEQQTWAEAVVECVSDSAERERLIRLYDYDELVQACLALGTLALTAKTEYQRAEKLQRELTALRSETARSTHDWQPDGGVLRFESHPGGEAPHVHTTCAKCGARAWFLEYQWELLAKGCVGINPSGWDTEISREIAPELDRIAAETRQAAHAEITVGSPAVTEKP